MRILVTGANGMLGADLCQILEGLGHAVVRTDVHDGAVGQGVDWEALDITDLGQVEQHIRGNQPDVVIHAAAYTDVDGCERNPDLAYRINALGTWHLAAVCGAHHVKLVYISTDFVFDGEKGAPYTEYDATNPLGHYGASKLAGEKHVVQLCRQHWIIRTQWLFGLHGKSFPSTILRLAETRPELTIVADQIGSPTHTVDLAEAITGIIGSPLYGTYHVCNAGSCSWYELAVKTLELAGVRGTTVKPIPASQYPTPTRRPAYSVLRRYALELQGRDSLRPWQQALGDFVHRREEAIRRAAASS